MFRRGAMVVAVLACAACAACASFAFPPTPLVAVQQAGAREIPAPDSARAWWEAATRCLRLNVPFDSTIRFFVGTTIPESWAPGGTAKNRYAGYANPLARLVLLTPGYERSAALVVHEMMHIYAGYGHPKRYFNGTCVTRR